MSRRELIVSDRTGEEVKAEDRVKIVVRAHPELKDGKARFFDVDQRELDALSCFQDRVLLEVLRSDNTSMYISCTLEEFEPFFASTQLAEAPLKRPPVFQGPEYLFDIE